jgi:uncharacterized RDD family membrane protein YckC
VRLDEVCMAFLVIDRISQVPMNFASPAGAMLREPVASAGKVASMEPLQSSSLTPLAACARHPAQSSLGACQRCGDYVCLECAVRRTAAHVYCPACASALELPNAALHRRFFGNLIDYLGFWLLVTLTGMVASMLAVVAGLILLGINFAMLHYSGLTLGKLAMGTRIVTKDNARVELWRVLLIRGPLYLFGAFTGLALIDALFIFGSSRRTLHDLAAGTRVVDAVESAHLYAD